MLAIWAWLRALSLFRPALCVLICSSQGSSFFLGQITGVQSPEQQYRMSPTALTQNWLCPFACMAMVKCDMGGGAGESTPPPGAHGEAMQHREAGKD